MLLHTAEVAFVIFVAGGVLLASGRTRPRAWAVGRGAVIGTLLAGLVLSILSAIGPQPRPPTGF